MDDRASIVGEILKVGSELVDGGADAGADVVGFGQAVVGVYTIGEYGSRCEVGGGAISNIDEIALLIAVPEDYRGILRSVYLQHLAGEDGNDASLPERILAGAVDVSVAEDHCCYAVGLSVDAEVKLDRTLAGAVWTERANWMLLRTWKVDRLTVGGTATGDEDDSVGAGGAGSLQQI
jgi:hypothetical protein